MHIEPGKAGLTHFGLFGHAPAVDASLTSLSVVLPSYNEAKNLRGVVKAATLAAAQVAEVFEVIVVDDGSRDESAELLRDLQAIFPELHVVRHDRNRGYGAALHSGFSRAQFEWVFYTDADHQFDLDELGLLAPMADDYDLVTGYRLQRRDGSFRLNLGRGWDVADQSSSRRACSRCELRVQADSACVFAG